MLKEEESNLIGQGAYGCVYKKNLTCSNNHPKKKNTKEYLTKVHMKKDNAKSEVEVSALIKQINNFDRYFSPVLESCSANLAEINKTDIEKCNFIKDTTVKYYTTKVKYVVGNSMDEYIKKLFDLSKNEKINKSAMKRQYDKIVYLCDYLEKGIKILNENEIVHFDLKESNIIVDTTDRPIIIDFGLSVNIKKLLTQKDFADAFYYFSYDKDDMKYDPWCVEIALISYLSQQHEFEEKITEVISKRIIEIANRYIDAVELTTTWFINENDIKEYKEKKRKLVSKYVGKTCRELVNEIMKTYDKWDIYSIGVMLMNELDEYIDKSMIEKRHVEMIHERILF